MEEFKKALAVMAPHLLRFLLDNRHLLIDFLKAEALKTDNKIDDFVIMVLEDYLDNVKIDELA